MKKYFLTLCTLGLGMLAALWVCAQSETTASEKTEKTPGEQLLEFMMNPPEKFDIGGIIIHASGFSPGIEYDKTNYFRSRLDTEERVSSGFSRNRDIIEREKTGDLSDYDSIAGQCEDSYWLYGGNQLTTWTNRGIASESNNDLLNQVNSFKTQAKNFICLFFPQNYVRISADTFDILNDEGKPVLKCTIQRNEKGFITEFELMSIKLNSPSEGVEQILVGQKFEFSYQNKLSIPFFPSEVCHYFIYQNTKGSKEITQKEISTYQYVHLNLNPEFQKSDFELQPVNEGVKRFWVEGTNIVFVEDGVKDRILSHQEVVELDKMIRQKQPKYRGIYIILAIAAFIVCVLLIFRNKKNR
ncbi:MAG: hypothetical protein IKQ24_01040 [Verrucomicrobia bacterium]|nr:hypothetical protein [Verrucomicrobiota bacterium]